MDTLNKLKTKITAQEFEDLQNEFVANGMEIINLKGAIKQLSITGGKMVCGECNTPYKYGDDPRVDIGMKCGLCSR